MLAMPSQSLMGLLSTGRLQKATTHLSPGKGREVGIPLHVTWFTSCLFLWRAQKLEMESWLDDAVMQIVCSIVKMRLLFVFVYISIYMFFLHGISLWCLDHVVLAVVCAWDKNSWMIYRNSTTNGLSAFVPQTNLHQLLRRPMMLNKSFWCTLFCRTLIYTIYKLYKYREKLCISHYAKIYHTTVYLYIYVYNSILSSYPQFFAVLLSSLFMILL